MVNYAFLDQPLCMQLPGDCLTAYVMRKYALETDLFCTNQPPGCLETIKRVALRTLMMLSVMVLAAIDIAIWTLMIITVYPAYQKGREHFVNVISYLAAPILSLAMPFGYFPRINSVGSIFPIPSKGFIGGAAYRHIHNYNGANQEQSAREFIHRVTDQEMRLGALNTAAAENHLSAAEIMVKEGGVHPDKAFALHAAARSYFSNPLMLQKLVELGANPDLMDSKGRTPLMNAIIVSDMYRDRDSETRILNELLSKGINANPNVQDEEGYTALHVAVDSLLSRSIQTLIQHGANARLRTRDGESPFTRLVVHYIRVSPFHDGSIPHMLEIFGTCVRQLLTHREYADGIEFERDLDEMNSLVDLRTAIRQQDEKMFNGWAKEQDGNPYRKAFKRCREPVTWQDMQSLKGDQTTSATSFQRYTFGIFFRLRDMQEIIIRNREAAIYSTEYFPDNSIRKSGDERIRVGPSRIISEYCFSFREGALTPAEEQPESQPS